MIALATSPIGAATWDGGGGADTRWQNPANWDLGDTAFPAGEDVNFGSDDTLVTFDAEASASTVDVYSGNVTFNLGANTLYTTQLQIGNAGGIGKLTVDGSSDGAVSTYFIMNADPERNSVGNSGNGTIDIINGAHLIFRGHTDLGVNGLARVNIDGVGSKLEANGNILQDVWGIGRIIDGAGTKPADVLVNVTNGASLERAFSSNLVLGSGGGKAILQVDGASSGTQSSFIMDRATLTIAKINNGAPYSSQGALKILNGGKANILMIEAAGGAGNVAEITVHGSSGELRSTLTATYLRLGYLTGGTATLNVTGGALAQFTSDVYIGLDGGTGAVVVDGAGSSLKLDYNLTVGSKLLQYGGNGAITVKGGGTMENPFTFIGRMATGAVTIEDPGSSWIAGSGIEVGDNTNYSTATFTIRNGASVSTTGRLKIYDKSTNVVNFASGRLSVGSLDLSGNASRFNWTGGTLVVNGAISNAGSTFNVPVGANLTGAVTVNAALAGGGTVSPGNSPGIMTANQVDPSGGMDFAFEFTTLNPAYSLASSGNDVLRLTDSSMPITTALTTDNVVDIYLDYGSSPEELGNKSLTGGFFTDKDTDFTSLLSGATFRYWYLDDSAASDFVLFNSHKWITMSEDVLIATVPADFNGDSIADGYVMQLNIAVPEPSSIGLIGLAGTSLLRRRRYA